MIISGWIQWGILFWVTVYIGEGVKRDYDERARLQAENQWLYKHCLENHAQLKAHTDACDRVTLLFAETPLQGALLHPAWAIFRQVWARAGDWYDGATSVVKEHRWVFVGVWLALFLVLPRVCLGGAKAHELQREARLRTAAMLMTEQSTTTARRRRCIV